MGPERLQRYGKGFTNFSVLKSRKVYISTATLQGILLIFRFGKSESLESQTVWKVRKFGKSESLESLQFYEELHYQQLRCLLTEFKKSTLLWQQIHQFFTFWKVGKFGKSTILRRNALSTTQIVTKWIQKVYRDMARDPPIFQFRKVGKSTNLRPFNMGSF